MHRNRLAVVGGAAGVCAELLHLRCIAKSSVCGSKARTYPSFPTPSRPHPRYQCMSSPYPTWRYPQRWYRCRTPSFVRVPFPSALPPTISSLQSTPFPSPLSPNTCHHSARHANPELATHGRLQVHIKSCPPAFTILNGQLRKR